MKTISILGFISLLGFTFTFTLKDEDNISRFLNRKKKDKELKQFMHSFGAAPDKVYKSTDSYYEEYHRKGISFNFDYDNKLVAIFLYSNLSEDYKNYEGKLPYGLSFDLTRKDVEERFGSPEYNGESDYKNTSWVIYRSKGFGLTYNGLESDSVARISEIAFQLYQ
ncbi:hypothetical protein [Pontibacter oryzae]|uniref:Uncharacterized protein n=1 Tax=Pontibacter oryzae TaxID=2304593 RepID=A0A399RZT0_9BACT|nr:hypothetical protein [Pontibacter oryzae]RIJ37266.1 hypothetical protein D1627_08990 [Pontibacter oryzae]